MTYVFAVDDVSPNPFEDLMVNIKTAVSSIAVKVGNSCVSFFSNFPRPQFFELENEDNLGYESIIEKPRFKQNVKTNISGRMQCSIFFADKVNAENDKKCENYLELKKTFEEHFTQDASDKILYESVFSSIAESICDLDMCGSYVDVSRIQKLVDFNVCLQKDVFLSVAKRIDQKDNNNVMFSLSHENRVILVDQMDLNTLMFKIKQMLSD